MLACVCLSPLFARGGSQQQAQQPPADPAVSNVPSETIVKEVPVEIIETRMPLTTSILQRLDNKPEDITKFQLINLGQISLEREYTELKTTRERGGKVNFEDIHTREEIVVQDQTYGQALKREDTNDEVILFVCFEESGENTLKFAAKKDNPDGYFYLKKDNSEGIPLSEEEKGVIKYASKQYKVKYNGEKEPYLLIKLNHNDTNRINAYTMKGRIVE
jgi:hypothetical protein